MSQGQLGIADEEFFTAPFKNRDAIEDPLLAQQKDVLIVDAPKKVFIDTRSALPVAMIRVSHFALASGVRADEFGIVVAADALSGRVRVGRAVTPSEKREEPEEPREGEGMCSDLAVIDVREQTDLPWRPSALSVSLIIRDEISEAMKVALTRSPGVYVDKAIEEQREKEALKAPLPAVHPALREGKPLPAYGKVDGAPEVPQEPGLTLAADRVVRLNSDAPLVLKGSFRVKVPKPLFVDAARAEPLPEPKPAALVPVTLVITASVAPAPFVYNLMVPSWQADPETGLASGSFAVDLDRAGNLRASPRTFFVYGFAFDQRFGPLPIGMAGEEE